LDRFGLSPDSCTNAAQGSVGTCGGPSTKMARLLLLSLDDRGRTHLRRIRILAELAPRIPLA
jgi:hypothetical protein